MSDQAGKTSARRAVTGIIGQTCPLPWTMVYDPFPQQPMRSLAASRAKRHAAGAARWRPATANSALVWWPSPWRTRRRAWAGVCQVRSWCAAHACKWGGQRPPYGQSGRLYQFNLAAIASRLVAEQGAPAMVRPGRRQCARRCPDCHMCRLRAGWALPAPGRPIVPGRHWSPWRMG